jgi:hypothetical protein
MAKEILSETEAAVLILAFLDGSDGKTEAEIQKAIDWAETVRIDAALLMLVLKGDLRMAFNADGDPEFAKPTNNARMKQFLREHGGR